MIILQVSSDLFIDSNAFKIIKAIVEIIYLLSAPLVAFLAYRGLEQIKLAKEESKLNSKRQALTVTADRCADFNNRILPLIDKLDRAEKEHNVVFFDEIKVEIDGDKITYQSSDPKNLDKISSELLTVINALESFAIFFRDRSG